VTRDAPAAPTAPLRGLPAAAALALVFAVVALWLFTRHNNFAFFYHSDESAKVEQVLTGTYNFHHPMLLLSATELWLRGGGGEATQQQTVEAGRFVSAVFSALAIGAFSLLGFVRSGWLAAVAVGLLLTCHQQLFELAHYMKEDPALLVGMALTFLALACYQRRPSWVTAAGCGMACGVAISGKYLGVVVLICALPVLMQARGLRRGERFAHLGVLLAGALAVLVVANLPLLRDLATFRASFDREMEFVVDGSKGMTRRVPHTVYLNIFADNTTPMIWLLLAVYYVRFWQTRREHDALAWVLALFPLVLTLVFSFSPKTNDRYYLPVTATFYYLAALALAELPHVMPQRWRGLAGMRGPAPRVAALLIAAAWEAPRLLEVYRAFQHDDRRELAELIRTTLPAEVRIAQDSRVMLPDRRNRERGKVIVDLPQQVVSGPRYASDLGDLDQLRAAGFTHVAVTESSYGRFFLNSMKAKEEYRDEHARHRTFYERLDKEGTLLFDRPRGTVIYLHPGLRLYQIATETPPTRS